MIVASGSPRKFGSRRLSAAGVLHDQVTRWLEDAAPARDDAALVAGLVPAAGHVEDPELARTLGDIEGLITARTHALVRDVLHRPPARAIPLGPPPRDSTARRAWLDAIAVVAGYRDLHQIQTDQPLGDTDDRHPDRSDDRRRATAAVATAARLARTRRATTSARSDQPCPGRSIQR